MNKKTNTIFFRQSVKEKNADGNLLSWFSVQFNRALDVMNQAVTSPGGLLQPGAKENIAYLTSTERRLASLWFWILSRSNTLGAKSRKTDTFMRRDAGGWGGGGGRRISQLLLLRKHFKYPLKIKWKKRCRFSSMYFWSHPPWLMCATLNLCFHSFLLICTLLFKGLLVLFLLFIYCFVGPIIKDLLSGEGRLIYCNLFQALGCLVRAEGKNERGLGISSVIN